MSTIVEQSIEDRLAGFLNNPHIEDLMLKSSYDGRPAIEGIISLLRYEVLDDTKNGYNNQLAGKAIKQVMLRLGLREKTSKDVSNLVQRGGNGPLVSRGMVYEIDINTAGLSDREIEELHRAAWYSLLKQRGWIL
jgi:hypothetical protein